ncbi:MAG: DUF2780 domain-containing protein [Agarilytica sp.]
MKHLRSTLFVAVLAAFSLQAQAGIWDSITAFFSGSETEAPLEENNAPTEKEGPSKVETGLKLIPLITQTLGVNDGQAKGGMGALLQAAQLLMSGTDFDKLSNAIPEAGSLLGSAPKVEQSSGGLMDSAMKMAAEQSDTVKAGLNLASQFKSLEMSPEMIPKFTEVAQGFLENGGAPETSNLFSSALSDI